MCLRFSLAVASWLCLRFSSLTSRSFSYRLGVSPSALSISVMESLISEMSPSARSRRLRPVLTPSS